MGFELGNLAERSFHQQAAYGEKVTVPTPVVEDAEQPLLLLRQLDQRLRLGQIQGERLVDHHVLAGQQGLTGDGGMSVVGVAITTRSTDGSASTSASEPTRQPGSSACTLAASRLTTQPRESPGVLVRNGT